MNRWYALTTKAGPFTPARGLREQRFSVYVAKTFIAFRPPEMARRLYAIARPRFEGYIFVHADPEQGHFGPISNTRGVAGLVPPYPAPPCAIDDSVIEGLRAAEDAELDAIRTRATLKSQFRLGQTVLVDRGAWKGYHGEIVELRDGYMSMFIGASLARRIPEADVTAVKITQGEKI